MSLPWPTERLTELQRLIQRLEPLFIRVQVYRAFRPGAWDLFQVHPLDGRFRGRVGGRLHLPAGGATLYTSTTRQNALAIARATARNAGFDDTLDDLELLCISVVDVPVLDLTNPRTLDLLRLPPDALQEPLSRAEPGTFRPPRLSQLVGQAARASLSGILAPHLGEQDPIETSRGRVVVLFLAEDPPYQPRHGRVTIEDMRPYTPLLES